MARTDSKPFCFSRCLVRCPILVVVLVFLFLVGSIVAVLYSGEFGVET